MRGALPGVLLGAVLAAAALVANAAVPQLSSLLVAILLGVAVRNLGLVPAAAEPGLKVLAKRVLRIGVVLLGLRLSVPPRCWTWGGASSPSSSAPSGPCCSPACYWDGRSTSTGPRPCS